jgi:uncharacterized protein with GYD domain
VDKAYVLIKTRVGQAPSVRESLMSSEHIRSVDLIIGPYDLVAIVEAENHNAIGAVVMRLVHEVGGVENTITCPVVQMP